MRFPRYQVIAYSPDSGEDEKLEYTSIRAAKKAAKSLWPKPYYTGWAIWDHSTRSYVSFMGDFPVPEEYLLRGFPA